MRRVALRGHSGQFGLNQLDLSPPRAQTESAFGPEIAVGGLEEQAQGRPIKYTDFFGCSREERNPGRTYRKAIQQGSPTRSYFHGKQINIGRPEIELRSPYHQQLNHIRKTEARSEMNWGGALGATRVEVCSRSQQLFQFNGSVWVLEASGISLRHYEARNGPEQRSIRHVAHLE